MAAVNFKALLEEFKRTNWKDPGTWHAIPKLVVLLAILIAIPVTGYVAHNSSQVEDLERLRNEENSLKEQYLNKKKQAINLDLHRQQLREIDTQFGALLRQLLLEVAVLLAAAAAEQRRGAKRRSCQMCEGEPHFLAGPFFADLRCAASSSSSR